MGRKRITHWFDDEAASRLAAMQTIDPVLDFGGGLSLVAYSAAIDDHRGKITAYSQQFAIAEEKRTVVKQSDKALKKLSSRFLSAVAARYGKDSEEYAKAGGTRTSEWRKPSKPNGSPQNEPGSPS
jgi:hypothetical protein